MLCAIAVIAVEEIYPGSMMPSHVVMAMDRAARSAMAWAMVVVLFRLADRYWNRDHRSRRALGRAVFPAYIVHHPVIVAVTWFTLPLALGPWSAAALVLTATVGACAVTCALARAMPWFGILVGVPSPTRRYLSMRPETA